jgi:uncharacterized protein YdhG (YjbR/CyaY superfamily)
MANKPTNTTEYFATLSSAQRTALERLRDTIRSAVPEATEYFSYAMPAVAIDGKPFLWFAAWKNHYSLYPIGAAIIEAHGEEARAYEAAKGTIRFPASEALPLTLVTSLAKARATEFRVRGK